MTVQITLPFPPSANRLWTRTRHGMRKTDEYVKWITEAGWFAKAQKPMPISGPYKISIHAQRPDNRKRDLGNLLKSIEDLLQSIGMIDDDSLSQDIQLKWAGIGDNVIVYLDRAEIECG